MIKAKWLYSEIPTSLKQLAELMLANQYSEESSSGFLLSTSTNSTLSGRYIERVIKNSVIEDPFGEQSKVETVSYYICRFNWSSGSKLLCITDPPRSLRKFTNCLHGMLGLGLVIAEITVNPDQWLNEIERSDNKITVTHISSFGIHTPNDSLAKIAVTGHKDVREDFFQLVGDRRHRVSCVKFSMVSSSDVYDTCELLKAGSCKITSASPVFFLEELRRTLEQSYIC